MTSGPAINKQDTARRLGASEATVRNWAKRGVIRAGRVQGTGLRDLYWEQVERMRQEMTSQLAPADEGPVVERPSRGLRVPNDE